MTSYPTAAAPGDTWPSPRWSPTPPPTCSSRSAKPLLPARGGRYAISYVYMARYLTPKEITPTALAAAQLIAATGLDPAHPRSQPRSSTALHPRPLGRTRHPRHFGTGLAYIINYALIRNEGPTRASVVTYLVPIVSITLGAAALNEPLTPSLLTGSILVLIGIAISRRIPSRSDR